MIKHNSNGTYQVYSEGGGHALSKPYKSKSAAEKRLRQIEYFKHRDMNTDTNTNKKK